MKYNILLLILIIITLSKVTAQENRSAAGADTAYTRVLNQRVNKFLADIIDMEDSEKYIRVRDIIVKQYKDLSNIHDTRDKRVKAVRAQDNLSKDIINARVDAIKNEAIEKLYGLHFAFLAKLSSELTLEQVERIKDGMTYGMLYSTYNKYLELLPGLTEEQKRQILAYLLEARELAMDVGTSHKKHHTFRKYKGKINNYLSKEGYDLKKAEQEMSARQSKEPE